MSLIDRCRDRWADLHPFWRILLVAVLLAALALAAGRPALEGYLELRTGRRLAAAQEALGRRLHFKAFDLSLQVLRSDSSRQEAIPVLLRSADALGDPRRSEVAHALLAGKDFTPDDRAFAWQVVCRSSPAWFVMVSWSQLPESDKSSPVFVAALVDRMLREDLSGDAARLLQEQKQPLPDELEVRLMCLLVAKGTDEALHQFQKSLIARLAGHPEDAEPWFALLDELPQASLLPGTFAALAAWQESRGTPDTPAVLRLARCEMAAHPTRAEEIFAATLARLRDAEPLACARWCFKIRRIDEAAALLATLPADQAAAAFELRQLICEQTGQLANWAALLANPPPDTDLVRTWCERAHLASLMKDEKTQAAAENRALRLAGESSTDDALIRLARHAESRKLNSFSQRVWVEAVRKRSGPLPLSDRIKPVIQSLAAARKETELLGVLTTYSFIEPANPVVLVQHGYLSCLSGHTTPANLKLELAPIHERLPASLPVRCVLALAYLLENQPAEAMALTDDSKINWFAATPAYRAIRGITLTANGRNEEAAVLLKDFPWDELLPSEKRILRGLAETPSKDSPER
jgi:hypothetical protein